LAPNKKILAVLKANAYGHGLLEVAKTLADVDAFGVACLEEAAVLRQAALQQRIVLLEGFFSADELLAAGAWNLDIVIHSFEQLQIVEQCTLAQPVTVWLKIDTGMHRLGFPLAAVAEVWQRLSRCRAVKQAPILMTHFAQAERIADPTTKQQWQLFSRSVQGLHAEISLANSAALLAWPETHGDWLRPGLLLYGVSPLPGHIGLEHGLLPVMTFRSRIVAIKQLNVGDAVGYGGQFVCPEPMRVGLVPIGYGDGYPYHAPNGTPVLLNDKRVPLVGSVSMDRLTIDLRTQPAAQSGDEVVLWGRGLPAEEIARYSQTIPYELLCSIQRRAHVINTFGEAQGD
jgi:alanine racemase